MKITKRLTAALLAVSSMTAVTASLNSAFAYEGLTLEEEHFIASYEDEAVQQVAAYCVNKCATLEEARSIVDGYAAYRAEKANGISLLSASSYYNTTTLAPTQHFVVAIMKVPLYDCNTGYDITLNNGVTYTGQNDIWYPGTITNYQVSYVNPTISVNANISGAGFSRHTAIACYYVQPSSSITSEYGLYNSISFDANGSNNLMYETCASGDVNHNGVIDSDDSYMILEYVAGITNEFETSPNTPESWYCTAANKVAADFQRDGVISLSDYNVLNRYINANRN